MSLLALLGLGACASPPTTSTTHEGDARPGAGPARHVPVLFEGFREQRAMGTLAYADAFYRAPASDGYERVLEYLHDQLEGHGYGVREHLELTELVVEEDARAWTPRSGHVTLEKMGGEVVPLHEFHRQADQDRLLLPLGAPSCDVYADAVVRLSDVRTGTVLVTDAPPTFDILRRAEHRGALAVLSSSMASYNVGEESDELLEDAMRFRLYPAGAELPVAQISRASHARISEAVEQGRAVIHLKAQVSEAVRDVRMLAATIVGADHPDEAVVIPSHIEYAGASDNASGFAGTLEGALSLVEAIDTGRLPRPARSLVFLFGPQIRQTRTWMAHTDREAVASVTLLAAGDSPAFGGSPLYLERTPDPGAVRPLPPDMHTLWGARPVEEDTLEPSGVAVVARCAMHDVAAHVGGWRTVEHPWEGGSDHDVFLQSGVPAVLFWHFTEAWYHTSLDRIDRISPGELKRSAVTALCTALSMAAPDGADLERYQRAIASDEALRVEVARSVGDEHLAESWADWYVGAAEWLADLCR